MPTPSGNAPDPNQQSPRNFSSCPDPDDNEQQQELQPQESPGSPDTETPRDFQEPPSQSTWRPASPSPQSPYDSLHSPAEDTTSPPSVTMSPMANSAAPAVADGSSSGFEPSNVLQRFDFNAFIDENIEMDGGGDDDEAQKEDTDEDMSRSAEEGSDEESLTSAGYRPVVNLQDHLLGLIRRIDELNARDAARDAARAAGDASVPNASSTIRPRPDGVRSRSAADHGTRANGEGSGSSTRDDDAGAPGWGADTSMLGMGYEFADSRVISVSPSTYLRPGSRFHGTQQSERQRYDVQVEIKHVDLRESFLCGYLRIQGLTEDHPTLTTYFEGEIIGTKYGFNTQHPSWGASDKTDMSHWAKFQAFRPFQKQMKKGGGGGGNIVIKDVPNRENIFMRWKEHFLVPDHRVRTIHGASFEGFYYICFNQLRGEVSGIYFHSKSEKFQQLELKHVEDKGCYGAVEFR